MGAVNERHAVEEKELVGGFGHGGALGGFGDFPELLSDLQGDGFGRNFVDETMAEMLGVGGVMGLGMQNGIDADREGGGIVGLDDEAADMLRDQGPRADGLGGDDGAAEDERLDEGAGEGIEERGKDDEAGAANLADDFIERDFSDQLELAGGEFALDHFERSFPALKEAGILLGEIAGDDEGGVGGGGLGLQDRLEKNVGALAFVQRAEEENTIGLGGRAGVFRVGGADEFALEVGEDDADFLAQLARGKGAPGVGGERLGDELGVGEDAVGAAEGETKRGLLIENGNAVVEAIAERLNLGEDGRGA